MDNPAHLLHVKQLGKQFGGIQAVQDYELALGSGEIVGLIGPNGAGKTTIFNLLSGTLQPTSGSIHFLGRDVTSARPDTISAMGLARTFQNIRLFNSLSVLDNVKAGFHRHHGDGFWATVLSLPGHAGKERRIHEKTMEILDFFGLADQAGQPAGILAYGDQRRLEMARALATDPKVILLDEPAAGMNPQESESLKQTIGRLRDELGMTVLLVEHDMQFVMSLCERIQVLVHGVLLTEGPPREIQSDPEVIEAYLGTPRKSPKGRSSHEPEAANQGEGA